jgi:nucleoside-diphosphate-sugar epimerase
MQTLVGARLVPSFSQDDIIVTTGTTGFLGRALLPYLRRSGAYIAHVKGRSSDVYSIIADGELIFDVDKGLSEIRTQTRKFRNVYLVHLATTYRTDHTLQDIDLMVESCIRLPTTLIDFFTRYEQLRNFINISTLFQHYNNSLYSPFSLYAAMKEAMSNLLVHYSENEEVSVVDLTVGDLYGPGDSRGRLVTTLLKASVHHDSISLGSGSQVLSPVFVDDCAKLISCLIPENDQGKLKHKQYSAIGTDQITVSNLVRLIEELFGTRLIVSFDPDRDRKREVRYLPEVPNSVEVLVPSVGLKEGLTLVRQDLVSGIGLDESR